MAVLSWAYAQPHAGVLDEKVVIGRGDHDRPPAQGGAVFGRPAWQGAGPTEDLCQRAWAAGCDMEHNAHGCLKVRREAPDNVLERLDSARGRADYNEVAARVIFGVGGWFAHT